MNVNFIGNFDEAFFFLIKNGYNVEHYFYQTKKASELILLYCVAKGIPVIEIYDKETFNCDNVQSAIAETSINIIASFGIIIPSYIVKNHIFINVHPGILPNYRGRHPLPQAILNKEKYAGITVHILGPEGIDTGQILALEKIEIDYNENYLYNELKLRGLIQSILYKSLSNYCSGTYKGKSIGGTYYKPLEREKIERIFTTNRLADL